MTTPYVLAGGNDRERREESERIALVERYHDPLTAAALAAVGVRSRLARMGGRRGRRLGRAPALRARGPLRLGAGHRPRPRAGRGARAAQRPGPAARPAVRPAARRRPRPGPRAPGPAAPAPAPRGRGPDGRGAPSRRRPPAGRRGLLRSRSARRAGAALEPDVGGLPAGGDRRRVGPGDRPAPAGDARGGRPGARGEPAAGRRCGRGSLRCRLQRATLERLRPAILATGRCDAADLDAAGAMLLDPARAFRAPRSGPAWGRRPAAVAAGGA